MSNIKITIATNLIQSMIIVHLHRSSTETEKNITILRRIMDETTNFERKVKTGYLRICIAPTRERSLVNRPTVEPR